MTSNWMDSSFRSSEQIRSRLAELMNSLPDGSLSLVRNCLANMQFQLSETTLSIRFPHDLYARYYHDTAQSTVEQLISAAFGSHIKIEYSTPPPLLTPDLAKPAQANLHGPDPFSSFIISEKNRFALEAARTLATSDSPAKLLIIHGPVGSGKTHLLAAIQQTIIMHRGASCCTRCRADSFTFPADPEHFWSTPKALLLDDVQELPTVAQNRLAALLDAFAAAPAWARVAIVLHNPDSDFLAERLAMRLAPGLKVEVCMADLAMRLQYAELKCQELGLPRKQAMLLARHSRHIPGLAGLLQKLAFYGKMTGQFLSAAQIEKMALPANQLPDWQRLIQAVASELQLKPAELLDKSRKKHLVLARQAAMYLCWFKLGLGYSEIGRLFGGRDHSTVIHSISKIQQFRQTDSFLHNLLTKLENAGL